MVRTRRGSLGVNQDPPPTIPYELFDCLQVNLAVLADRWHGTGNHLRLGSTLRFAPDFGADGLPSVARSVEQNLADAQGFLGIVVRAVHRAPATADIPLGEGCYVVSDAYHLPWVPYFRKRHMAHSFLAATDDDGDGAEGGGVTVVDGYRNETAWGSARPGRWTLPAEVFAAAVPSPALVAELAPAAEGPGPASGALRLAGPDAVDGYVDAYALHPDRGAALDRLTLETWFLARSRKLHAAFRTAFGPPPDAGVEAHLRAWDALTEQTYLAVRRVERGRAEPPSLLPRLRELLHADAVVFGGAPDAAPAAGEAGLRGTVAGVAASVLRTAVGPLLHGRLLSDVPGFSSFRVVEIVERLEEELHVEFDADDLVPENLHDVDALCAVVRRALAAGPAPAHLEGA